MAGSVASKAARDAPFLERYRAIDLVGADRQARGFEPFTVALYWLGPMGPSAAATALIRSSTVAWAAS
jgi:hypothetical protein